MTSAGFPTKFVESITCGVPVITNDTSDLNEYAVDGRNAIILHCESFTDKLPILLENIANKQKTAPIVKKSLFDYREYIKKLETFMNI